MVLRGDDPISIDVRGTALDVLANTEHLVVAGSNSLSVLTVGSTSANTWVKLRSNRQLVRLLKFNPLSTGYFSSVSGQFIDLYSLGQGSHIQRLATFTAQSRKISDFCWCPFDDQFMITCAENDSVNFWDLRTNLRTPTARLGVTFGAGQSKFSPHLNNYLLTTHGTDIRLWDLRHTSQPVVQFKAHQAKIFCLDWHPHHREPNSFFTSANDSTLKLWNMADQKSTPSMVSMAPFCAWRLVFSHEGEELAALGLPPLNALALYSNYGLENPRLLKGIERDTLMDAAWHKSITYQKSTTKFLYTLSAVKQKLCRHPIAYELSNILRDEMATPITQSKTDEERDRLVEQTIDPELMQMASGSLDESIIGIDQQQRISMATTDGRNSVSGRSTIFGSVKNAPQTMMMMDTGGGGGGGGTPQSPIYSEWQRWIRAPNMAGGDLLTELEALRKHSTEGLYTTEVNFTRAAIGFSYMHLNKFNKINFEMRFHREFIDNGLVFVEVIQKDSPFTPERSSLFLTLLQQESDIQQKIQDNQTILCRILQRLPRIIDLMKVFNPSIDVPMASSQSKTSSQSGSASEDQQMSSSTFANIDQFGGGDSNFMPTSSNRTISAAVPCSYLPSPFDHRVPSPRNCGARFNRFGYLVLFGPMNTILWTKDGQMNDFYGGEGIPRIVPPMKSGRKGAGAFGRLGSTRSQPSEASKMHPRSLAEYCVFVNPIAPPINLRQTSSISGVLPFQSSPPLRCISPANASNRPTSPNNNQFPQSESISISNRQNQQQNNSLSPPSLLLEQTYQTKSISRVLGSSPNSSSSPAAFRSFSLQNVANSIRHRGTSMSGAIPPSPSQSIMPMPNTIELEKSQSPQANINIPPFAQQQSMIEYSTNSSMPAAVMPEQSFNSVVVVCDATALLPLSQNLAKTYKLLGSSPMEICQHNFKQAAVEGREDLMEMWKLVEQCIRTPSSGSPIPLPKLDARMKNFAKLFQINDQAKMGQIVEKYTSMDIPWAIHPFGRELVNRIIEHFANKFDLQSAAVIICVLSQLNNIKREYFQNEQFIKRPISSDRISSKLNYLDEAPIPPQMASLDVRIPLPPINIPSRKTSSTLNRPFVIDNFGSASRSKQSMDRLSPAPEHFSSCTPSPRINIHYPLPQKEANSEMLLDPILSSTRFEELKRKYADILYRWRMHKKCAEVLKFCKTEGEEAKIGIIKAINRCSICGQQLNESRTTSTGGCIVCRCPAIYCSICEQPCKGIISMCNSCGHGGHFMHLANWFNAQSQCPLGCGCECKF